MFLCKVHTECIQTSLVLHSNLTSTKLSNQSIHYIVYVYLTVNQVFLQYGAFLKKTGYLLLIVSQVFNRTDALYACSERVIITNEYFTGVLTQLV